jgi:hypothetical protein
MAVTLVGIICAYNCTAFANGCNLIATVLFCTPKKYASIFSVAQIKHGCHLWQPLSLWWELYIHIITPRSQTLTNKFVEVFSLWWEL